MPKYLVIQSFIESGSWQHHENDNLQRLCMDILIPSVARYCNRHGYKHVVYTDQFHLIDSANAKYGDHHGNLYHQYIAALKHKNDDVDYFVFPDADFFITHHAKPFIETKYLAGTLWDKASLERRAEDISRSGKDPETFKTVFGGIQIMTKEAAISLGEYLKSRFINYLFNDEYIQMHPNMLTVGDWIVENNIEPEDLSFYYNHIMSRVPPRPWDENDKNVGFWHIYGKDKTKKVNWILENIDEL